MIILAEIFSGTKIVTVFWQMYSSIHLVYHGEYLKVLDWKTFGTLPFSLSVGLSVDDNSQHSLEAKKSVLHLEFHCSTVLNVECFAIEFAYQTFLSVTNGFERHIFVEKDYWKKVSFNMMKDNLWKTTAERKKCTCKEARSSLPSQIVF